MTTIRVVCETTIAPDRVLYAARDFTGRRAEIFPAVSVPKLEVHAEGETSADVTEGTSAGIGDNWERCSYDWSRPDSVIATVTESNVYAVPGSSWEIKATASDSGSRVEPDAGGGDSGRDPGRAGLGSFLAVGADAAADTRLSRPAKASSGAMDQRSAIFNRDRARTLGECLRLPPTARHGSGWTS